MKPHVVIAGGGIGTLEGLLALRALAGDDLRISVVCAARHLTYRALSVTEPFGAPPPTRVEWRDIARDCGAELIPDAVTAVLGQESRVATRDGGPVRYDALLLALGARPHGGLPGALPFAGQRDVAAVGDALAALSPGRHHRIVFAVPSPVAWTLPLYELAFLTEAHGRRAGLDLELEIVTREDAPLGIFGAVASADVQRRLALAGIAVRTGSFAESAGEGRIWLELEGPLEADLVVALAPLHGSALPGLPSDGQGFTPVDDLGRVPGVDAAWAVGDMTTRPLKQGGLAAQQADVAAADIAARFGADVEVRPYAPVLRGLMLTGGDPVFLEHRPHDPESSRAGTAPLWWPPDKVAAEHISEYLARARVTRH
jgi:sulfide:quinone oxidoreductase